MNYSELYIADSETLGTGKGTMPETLGTDVRFFLSEPTFTGSAADLKTEAFWKTGIIAKKVIPFPLVNEVEPQNVEAAYKESASGATYKTKGEKRKTAYQFIENIVVHSGMKSYSDRGWNIWFYTEDGYLRCHTKGKDSFEGLKISRLYVNAQTTSTFGEPSHTPIIMEHNDVDDWDKEFGAFKTDFDMKDLEGVFQVEAYSASSTQEIGELTVNVTLTVLGLNAPLSGALPTDFELFDASGAVVVIDSASEVGTTGVYAIVATDAAISGTIGLKDVVTIGAENYQSNLEAFVTA